LYAPGGHGIANPPWKEGTTYETFPWSVDPGPGSVLEKSQVTGELIDGRDMASA
jgi:hypothetical protein